MVVGNPDQSWPFNQVSRLSFSNTPITGVSYQKTGLNYVSNHPSALTLSVATVAVPSFADAYPGQSATNDLDGDTVSALVEYAYGWNASMGSVGKGAVLPSMNLSSNRLVLNYQVRTNDQIGRAHV